MLLASIIYLYAIKKDTINKIREFNRFYTSMIGVTNNHILQSKYSLTEVRAMHEIYHHPNITARQLKEIIRIDEGYLSRLIGKLVKRKIISKKKSNDDKRIFSLTLTRTGESIFLTLNQRSSDAVLEIVQHLNKKEQTELIQLHKRIMTLLLKNNHHVISRIH